MHIQLSPGNPENLLKLILLACLKISCVARKKSPALSGCKIHVLLQTPHIGNSCVLFGFTVVAADSKLSTLPICKFVIRYYKGLLK